MTADTVSDFMDYNTNHPEDENVAIIINYLCTMWYFLCVMLYFL